MATDSYSTIIGLGTTQAFTSAVYGIKRTGRERKALETTLLTDADKTYIPSSSREPGSMEVNIRFSPAAEPAFDVAEVVTLYYPATGTGTYTALTNRPSDACSGFITKVDGSEIKIDNVIECTIMIKYSGARTVFTGAA